MKRNILLSLLSGLILSLSWPTSGFSPLIFIAFVPILWAEKNIRSSSQNSKTQIFIIAFISFLIWNVYTTGWLYYADPFGMVFANLFNTILMSLVFLGYHLISKRAPTLWSLAFGASLWLSFEYLHLQWDFSWPWLNLGHVFSEDTLWIQWYEYTGTFGGSLWVLLVNGIIFYRLQSSGLSIINLKNTTAITALLIGLPIILSFWIYHLYQPAYNPREVVILQPNIDPYTEKYNNSNIYTTRLLLDLTDQARTDTTSFAIAPETVLAENIPFNRFLYSEAFNEMKYYSQKHHIQLLWGIDTYELLTSLEQTTPQSNRLREGLWGNFYNMALFVNDDYKPQTYYKSKLVAGIETFPLKPILEPLIGNIMLDMGGTISTKTTQKERSVFKATDNSLIAPVICYESVYGSYVGEYVKNGAEFLAIITNDAWWQETQGHKQHLSLAKLRAIETRRDIARSANTGISAFIDQRGNIISQTQYNEQTALRGVVNLNQKITFYTLFGDYIAGIAIITLILLTIGIILRRRF